MNSVCNKNSKYVHKCSTEPVFQYHNLTLQRVDLAVKTALDPGREETPDPNPLPVLTIGKWPPLHNFTLFAHKPLRNTEYFVDSCRDTCGNCYIWVTHFHCRYTPKPATQVPNKLLGRILNASAARDTQNRPELALANVCSAELVETGNLSNIKVPHLQRRSLAFLWFVNDCWFYPQIYCILSSRKFLCLSNLYNPNYDTEFFLNFFSFPVLLTSPASWILAREKQIQALTSTALTTYRTIASTGWRIGQRIQFTPAIKWSVL